MLANNLRIQLILVKKAGWRDRGGSRSYCIPTQQTEMNAGVLLSFSFSFSLGHQPMGWYHRSQCGSSLLRETFLETFLNTYPEVCFHGDSKSSQADLEG